MKYWVTDFPEDGWFGSSTRYGASQQTCFAVDNRYCVIVVDFELRFELNFRKNHSGDASVGGLKYVLSCERIVAWEDMTGNFHCLV